MDPGPIPPPPGRVPPVDLSSVAGQPLAPARRRRRRWWWLVIPTWIVVAYGVARLLAPDSSPACGTGEPSATVAQHSIAQLVDDQYEIIAEGDVVNDTSDPIRVQGVNVSMVSSTEPQLYGSVESELLEPGETTAFTASGIITAPAGILDPQSAPDPSSVQIDWAWEDGLIACDE